MKLFQVVSEWLCKRCWFAKQHNYQPTRQDDGTSQTEEFVCTHNEVNHNLKVVVLGVECEFESSPMCLICTEKYLNQFSTLCASCKEPIFPGMPVGQAWRGAPHPYTHLTYDCCDSGGLYCGHWDEGRLLTLHELNPEKYPAGTSSVASHVFNTGGIVTESVD